MLKGTNVKKIIVGMIIVVVVGAGWFGVKTIRGAGTSQAAGEVVRLETVGRGEFVEVVSAPGQIEPKTEVEISAKISGGFTPHEEGSFVTKGDLTPIADTGVGGPIDSARRKSQLACAEAGRDAQQAQIAVENPASSAQKATLQDWRLSSIVRSWNTNARNASRKPRHQSGGV